jgi:hypothetical protein
VYIGIHDEGYVVGTDTSNAAREANVAEPEFDFTGFFKVTFKRNEIDASTGRQSAINRPQSVAIGRIDR